MPVTHMHGPAWGKALLGGDVTNLGPSERPAEGPALRRVRDLSNGGTISPLLGNQVLS